MNNRGWECPKCHNCYAPHVASCFNCNNHAPLTGNNTGDGAIQFGIDPYPDMSNRCSFAGSKGLVWGEPKIQSYAEMMGITITNKQWPENAHSFEGWTEGMNADAFANHMKNK